MAKTVEFWFEFASTYSYLSAMRIGALAEKRGIAVVWRPFLLGPIFVAQGWDTSPFNLYPAKGTYMWRDLARRAAKHRLPFKRPDGVAFPQNGLHAARLALVGLDQGWGADFCRLVFQAQFAQGADIADAAVLQDLAAQVGASADAVGRATEPANKQRLKDNVAEAQAKGVFGAPSFVVNGELFWGDDRLEDALDWVPTG